MTNRKMMRIRLGLWMGAKKSKKNLSFPLYSHICKGFVKGTYNQTPPNNEMQTILSLWWDTHIIMLYKLVQHSYLCYFILYLAASKFTQPFQAIKMNKNIQYLTESLKATKLFNYLEMHLILKMCINSEKYWTNYPPNTDMIHAGDYDYEMPNDIFKKNKDARKMILKASLCSSQFWFWPLS